MSTTALAVELLVIGYQVLLWLALLVFLFFKPTAEQIQLLKDFKEFVVIFSFVASYTFGAIMNGIASKIMDPCERKWVYSGQRPSLMRADIILQNPEAHSQLMKFYVAPRVIRSTIINIAISAVLVVIHVGRVNWLVWFLIVLLGFCIWGWYELGENYFVHLRATFKALKKKVPNESASS